MEVQPNADSILTSGTTDLRNEAQAVRPDLGNSIRKCSACIYFRKARPPDPLAGWHVLSSKIFELRTKWEKHLDERAMWEQQRFESALPFDFEPWFYAYCEKFSLLTTTPPRYELCADNNRDNGCKEFLANGNARV